MVDPDLRSLIETDEILAFRGVVKAQISDNNVPGPPDAETTIGEALVRVNGCESLRWGLLEKALLGELTCICTNTNHSCVGIEVNDIAAVERSGDLDDPASLDRRLQLGARRHGRPLAVTPASGPGPEPDKLIDSSATGLPDRHAWGLRVVQSRSRRQASREGRDTEVPSKVHGGQKALRTSLRRD